MRRNSKHHSRRRQQKQGMVLAARNPVETPHGKKRSQGQSRGDENLEELGIAIQDDHASKAGLATQRQDPARGQRSGHRGKDGPDYGDRRSLDPARYKNERQRHADQNQLRDE